MTDEQMIKRMKEIDEERNKLADEKRQYEKYFIDSKLKEVLNEHQTYIGKYFISKDLKGNKNDYIKAFKVLDVLKSPNESYALCLVLIDGYRYTCWEEYGIQTMTLGLWTFNESRMMHKESDLKVIDFYKEISEERFEELYLEHSNKLSNKFCEN